MKSCKTERERVAAEAKVEAVRVEADRHAEIARTTAGERLARELKQQRIDAHQAELKAWKDLNRDYPIPDYLQPYITGVLEDVDEDAAVHRNINIGVLGYRKKLPHPRNLGTYQRRK